MAEATDKIWVSHTLTSTCTVHCMLMGDPITLTEILVHQLKAKIMNINIHMYPHEVRFKSWFFLVVKNENLDDLARNHNRGLTPSQVIHFLTHVLSVFLCHQQ